MPIDNLYVINKARLIKDPETKDVGGRALTEVTLAVNPWGKEKERYASLIVVATFGPGMGDRAAKLRKGEFIGTAGPLFIRSYTTKDGRSGFQGEIKYPVNLTVFEPGGADKEPADDGPRFDPTPGGFDVV